MKRLLFLILPLLLVSCDVASRVRRATQTSDQKRNEEFGKIYDQQLGLERQRAKQTAEQLAIEQEVWRKYAEDTKQNAELEQEVWRKYAEDTKRNEQRTKEEDARAGRYEAVLKKWEEQATRFDAILDRWEKIEPLQQSTSR